MVWIVQGALWVRTDVREWVSMLLFDVCVCVCVVCVCVHARRIDEDVKVLDACDLVRVRGFVRVVQGRVVENQCNDGYGAHSCSSQWNRNPKSTTSIISCIRQIMTCFTECTQAQTRQLIHTRTHIQPTSHGGVPVLLYFALLFCLQRFDVYVCACVCVCVWVCVCVCVCVCVPGCTL